MIWIYLALFFFIAVAADWLTIRWHEAREATQILRVMRLSAIIEAINWAPIVFAIDSDILSAKVIALINIAGTTIGSGGAMYRMRLKKAQMILPEYRESKERKNGLQKDGRS